MLKLLRTAGCHCFWGQRKRWSRWFWSLFFFFPSADALCGDDEGDGDEGVLCWLSSRPCLYVFLLPIVSLSALSLVTLPSFLLFFCLFFSYLPSPLAGLTSFDRRKFLSMFSSRASSLCAADLQRFFSSSPAFFFRFSAFFSYLPSPPVGLTSFDRQKFLSMFNSRTSSLCAANLQCFFSSSPAFFFSLPLLPAEEVYIA